MSDRNTSKQSGHRRNDRQRREKQDQKNHKDNVRSTCLKVFQYEIDDLKDQLRATYSAEAKKSMDIAITAEEQKLIDEKDINKAVEKRLQEMVARFNQKDNRINAASAASSESGASGASGANGAIGTSRAHCFTLLNFFYLVRLAQQGFFQLVAGAYPNLELQAITYLCDKLVGLSLQSTRSKDKEASYAYSGDMIRLLNKLFFGDRETVSDGFKTTFRDIKDAIGGLAEQSFQKDNNAEQTEEQKLSNAKSGQLAQPPVWIVMPYTSMIDNGYSNVSGLINTLSSQLPQPLPPPPKNNFIPPQAISIGKNEPESHHNSGNEVEKETDDTEAKEMEQKKEEKHAEKQEEENKETVTGEKKEEPIAQEEKSIKEELVKEEPVKEEPVKEEPVKEEPPVKEEIVEQSPPQQVQVKVEEPLPQETQVVDGTIEENDVAADSQDVLDDDRFADPDMDEIGDISIRASPFDSFMDSSDELSLPKDAPDSPISSSSKSKWDDSFSNTAKEIPDSPQSSTDSKPISGDTASAGWKNFRAPDQTNRKKNTSGKKNQNRRSQR